MKIKLSKRRELRVYCHAGYDSFINWFYLRVNTNKSIKNFGFTIELDLLKLISFSIFTIDNEEPNLFI